MLHDLLKSPAPLKDELSKDGRPIDFHCINGKTETQPLPGLETSFEGPFYRYYDESVTTIKDLAIWIMTSSRLDVGPEDWMRQLINKGLQPVDPAAAVASIQDYVDHQSEPFDLILGYSEALL